MAGIDDIILRISTLFPLTTKGSELTWEELDNNFKEIYLALVNLFGGAGFQVYNPLTGYTGSVVVSYAGNLWLHQGAGPDTGVTPGTNPAVWQLTSSGLYMHQQNTDTLMAMGTSVEVAASDIWSILNEQIIPVTKAQFVARVAAQTLIPNRLYLITDSGLYLIRSISNSMYSHQGWKLVSVPDLTVAPQWSAAGSYTAGDFVTWKHLVYENQTGANGVSAPPGDATNWSVMAQYGTPMYKSIPMSCYLSITAGSAIVRHSTQDQCMNSVLNDTDEVTVIGDESLQSCNRCDRQSFLRAWAYRGELAFNELIDSIVTIYDESNTSGRIYKNSFINSRVQIGTGDLDGLQKRGLMSACHILNSQVEFPEGFDTGAQLIGVSIENFGGTILNISKDVNITIGGKISPDGGTIPAPFAMTASPVMDVTIPYKYPDIFGVWICTDAAETVSRMDGFPGFAPCKIMPDIGCTLTVNFQNLAGITTSYEFLHTFAGSETLNGDNGDYILVKLTSVPAGNVLQILQIVKAS